MDVPEGYVPINTPARKLDATPLPSSASGFHMQDSDEIMEKPAVPEIPGISGLEFFKEEDAQYFARLMRDERGDGELSLDELKERKIMRLLLKIKVSIFIQYAYLFCI